MAIARCQNCQKPTKNVTEEYAATAHPIGYPETALICGTVDCNFPALIWLTITEVSEYQQGKRIFNLDTHKCKVKVL